METEEKSFRDLQQDERIKKLERHLKLTQIKRPSSSQLISSPHMSISGISSIHGDNPLSDLSFCTPSGASSRSGSVILGSSINFRRKLSKNLQQNQKIRPATSSVFEQTLDSQKRDEDRMMMPPPPSINNRKPQSSVDTGQQGQIINSISAKTSLPQRCVNENSNVHSFAVENPPVQETFRNNDTPKQHGRIFTNWTIRLNDQGQIIIKGKLESGELARSKSVKRRVSATVVYSIHNHRYHLVGDIHDLREELPEYIRGKFYNGFPMDWENIRQIWQSYVASGYSLQFRWPRPMADSDDDLRSDITDLTVANFKNSKAKPTSFVSTPHFHQTAREMDKSSRKKENRSKRETNDSDISPVLSMATENSASRGKTSALETNCRSAEQERKGATLDNHLDNDLPNRSESAGRTLQPKEIELPRHGNVIPRWKVDVIIDNMMNKNCPKEYFDKVIWAIDCINELLTTPLASNSETAPDEGVSMNYNSHGQPDTTTGKNDGETAEAETSKNRNNPRPQPGRQAALSPSNSYSLESCAESEEESGSKRSTFVCEQPVMPRRNNPASHTSKESYKSRNSAVESKNSKNYSEVVARERNGSTPVRLTTKFDSRPLKIKENQEIQSLPREQIGKEPKETGRNKRKPIFDSSDDESEARAMSKPRTILANKSPIVDTNSQRPPSSKNQPTTVEKMNEKVAEGAFYDSDVSLLDTVPGRKPVVLSVERRADDFSKRIYQKEILRPDFSFADNEHRDRGRASSPMSKKSGNLSIEQVPGPAAAPVNDQCTVRLNKISMDQCNRSKSNSTPSKSEKTATERRKTRIDTSRQTNDPPGSDSENVSMRLSSRGRRIMPVLDYWNGERVVLKGRELVYSPGTCRPASVSANSIILQQTLASPNNTALSEPALPQTSATNLNKSPTGTTNCLKPKVDSARSSARKIGGILSEISENHDENGDNAMTSSKRITRLSMHNKNRDKKKNHKPKSVNENSDSSSEDERIHVVRSRKRRRIY